MAAARRTECPVILYLWSSTMPLSVAGVSEIRAAAKRLKAPLVVVETDALHLARDPAPIIRDVIAAGAGLHAPAVVLIKGGQPLGGAILGYKIDDAYFAELTSRLGDGWHPPRLPAKRLISGVIGTRTRDVTMLGRPGAYFRSVPGHDLVAYESERSSYLLNIKTGERVRGPGSIDFIPSPDGKVFVSPLPGRGGLMFYDATRVIDEARRGAGASVRPLFVDTQMKDQYPSIGVIHREVDGGAVKTYYRVLTSWLAAVAYREYVLTESKGLSTIMPVGPVRTPCQNELLSIPMLSPDGRYLAARDEDVAATGVYRLLREGVCRKEVNIGIQTGKVAWQSDSRRIAFAIPRGRSADRAAGAIEAPGVYVLDLTSGQLAFVAGSEEANRLAFPDFSGRAVAFMIGEPGQRSLRITCCLY